jgi:hypothetical protein
MKTRITRNIASGAQFFSSCSLNINAAFVFIVDVVVVVTDAVDCCDDDDDDDDEVDILFAR